MAKKPADPTPENDTPSAAPAEAPTSPAMFGEEIPGVPPMPPAVIPDPEPPAPVEDWRSVTPGSPAFPVKLLDGTWSAGGLVTETLCNDPAGRPRCVHALADGTCSGPPTQEIRLKARSCVSYRDRSAGG